MSEETEMMLRGYGLTTAEIFYRMPDFQSVLNSYIWQDYDLAPDYPKLFGFIEFWQRDIEGPLHSGGGPGLCPGPRDIFRAIKIRRGARRRARRARARPRRWRSRPAW